MPKNISYTNVLESSQDSKRYVTVQLVRTVTTVCIFIRYFVNKPVKILLIMYRSFHIRSFML